MPTARSEPIPRLVRRIAETAAVGLTDAQLLARFVADGNEASFSAIVRRHGPLVLAVCRRVLGESHDADDAFQATFLLLARKAASLARPDRVASWLYGVACRVATRARAAACRRRMHESRTPMPRAAYPDESADWRDLRVVLDEEVNRLPVRQREAVVLCYLGGRTNAEAARLLGCPRGTIATLLARARQRLRQRLAGRGLAPSAFLIGNCRAPGQVPARLVSSAAEAAVRFSARRFQAVGPAATRAAVLAKGVERIMFVQKLKPAALLLMTAVLVVEPPRDLPPEETVHRTVNFEVTAPTPAVARQVAQVAERQRKALALSWLGKELPAWEERCSVRVRLTDTAATSASVLLFEGGKARCSGMRLTGGIDQIATDLLPREVTHVLLACWLGRPVPRWAAEGAARLAETGPSRARYARAARTALELKRSLAVRQLLPLMEFPPDAAAFSAQGYSLTDFLIGSGGRAQFLAFVKEGSESDWTEAVRAYYGYGTLDDLERAWALHVSNSAHQGTRPGEPTGADGPGRGGDVEELAARVPRGPFPVPVLVRVEGDRLRVWQREIVYRAVSSRGPGGVPLTNYRPTSQPVVTTHPLETVKVYDDHGQEVDSKALSRVLAKERLVLLMPHEGPPDPLLLQLIKDGTLLLVLRPPPGAPVPAVPASATPGQ